MKLDSALSCSLDALIKAHLAKGDGVLVIVIDAGQRAVFRKIVIRRIPHLRYWIIGITDTAVDLVLVRFPEALVGLPAELAGRIIPALLYGSLETRRKVVVDLLEQRQGNIADAIVRLNGTASSLAF